MKLNSELVWLSRPSWFKLALAWGLGIGGEFALIELGKREVPYLLPLVALAAISLMLAVGISVWRLWYREEIDVFSLKGWETGLAIFLGLMITEAVLATPVLRPGLLSLSTLWTLFYCIVLIGFTEELWWRGIWFAMFKGRPLYAILLGSLLFGGMHYQLHGIDSAMMAFFVGLVFAAARYRGVSIGTLALTHGMNDWIAQGHLARWQWHHGVTVIHSLLFPICLLLAAVILRSRAHEAELSIASNGKHQ